MLDLATPRGLDQFIPPLPFSVPLPRRRAIVDIDMLRRHGQAQLFTVGRREALLPVDGDLLLVTLLRLTAIDRRTVGIGHRGHAGSSARLDPSDWLIVPGHAQDVTNDACPPAGSGRIR